MKLAGFDIVKSKKFIDIDAEMNTDISIHRMRENQIEVYNYRYERYFLLSEPPGAGKSTSIKFVCNKLLNENSELRVVIALPQSLIAKSFGRIILEYPDGGQREWDITRNLTETITNSSKIGELRNFLTKGRFGNELSDRVTIVTHITLSRLLRDYMDDINFSNTMFIIDEAHHVLYPENGNGESANRIGQLVRYLLEVDDPTTSIWFASATFFRGDMNSIIPPEELEKFTIYHLPLDEYWEKYIKHIRSFSYDFVTYTGYGIFDEVRHLLKLNGLRNCIIFCPYTGHLLRNSNKIEFRDHLIRVIREVHPNCSILDLIETSGRHLRKQILIESLVDFDIALAVRLFDEGTDWDKAESIIDLVPSNSLRIQVQRFGRLLRDLPGKDHISYHAFFPYMAAFDSEEERRSHFTNNFNAFTASTLLQNSIEPIPYPGKERLLGDEDDKDESKGHDGKQLDPLSEAVQYEPTKQKILAEVEKNLLFLRNIKEEPTAEEAKNVIIDTLNNFGITENTDVISTYIAKLIRRSTSTIAKRDPNWEEQTIDVSWMSEEGFDKVWTNDIYDGLLAFTTGVCDVNTFKEFREVYGETHTKDEAVAIAEQLTKENNGIMPDITWRRNNGYGWLEYWLIRYPELFAHIPIERSRRTDKEAVAIAELLAEGNNGVMPTHTWMKENGYGWLSAWICRKPELFAHIPIERSYRTDEEAVVIAEQLANENNVLNLTWLRKNGYGWLVARIKKTPELFAHIPIEKSHRTDEEVVAIAEQLANENNGIMPTHAWMKKNGYGWLSQRIYKKPELFAHIPVKKNSRTDKEAVAIAEQLANENNGIMPTHTWMRKNGYGWLSGWIYKKPELFAHIPMEKSHRTDEEAVVIAEQLTKENNGIMPTYTWMRKNGYGWLEYWLISYPELFAHIPGIPKKDK